jgi:hypothetical protein
MTFTRTNSGMSNMHLFYGVDIIIYTEGGSKSFSTDEVEAGEYSKSSVDIKFWDGVLKANNFGKRVQFRAIGSKTSSKLICEKILNGDIENVAIAMDRDLDQYFGGLLDSPFILYTKGYSWENDVFSKEITLSQVENMILEAMIPQDITTCIEYAYGDFRIYGKNLVKLEIIFRNDGIKFISDMNCERFFNSKNGCSINKKQVLEILAKKKELLTRPVMTGFCVGNICPFTNNYGKLLGSLSYTIICFILKKYPGYKVIPKQMIEVAMLERFIQKITEKKDDYYSGLVERLDAA